MPGRDPGPSSPLGPDVRTGLDNPSEGYRVDDLARRRARLAALGQLARVRELIDLYDVGEIQLDELGFAIGLVGAKLGKLACSGVLAA